MKQDKKEKNLVAASYINDFYKEISALTNNNSYYNNILIELENKYKGLELNNMSDEERNAIIATAQTVRHNVQKCYIMLISVLGVSKIKINSEIEKLYKKIKKDHIIERDELEQYTIELNQILVNDVIQDLIQNSQKVLESIYNE